MKKQTRWSGGVMLIAVALLFAGCVSTPTTPAPKVSLVGVPAEKLARAQSNVRVFERVWRLVADEHYDVKLHGVDWAAAGLKYGAAAATATDDRALYRSLNEMVGLLEDSHTWAFTPAEARERHTEKSMRFGIFRRQLEGRAVVTDVLPGSPADQAGVKAGWIFVARNGVPVAPGQELQLKDGEAVACDFLDEADRPVRVSLVRRTISIAPRRIVRELEGGYVYLRFDQFDWNGMRWLSSELKKHAAAPGVVIDLRWNPGGRAFAVKFGLGEFFDHAVGMGTDIDRQGGRDVENTWQLGSARYRGKVAVLVDRQTASCGEIFAAVLQEHGRATIVGRPTAGAVLSSWFYSLPDGGELQLSLSDYVTPKGRRLEGTGITPDVPVAAMFDSIAGLRAGRDLDLAAALAALTASGAPATGGAVKTH